MLFRRDSGSSGSAYWIRPPNPLTMKRNSKSAVVILSAISALSLVGQSARAVVVNVDFGLHDDHPDGTVSTPYTGTAGASDSGTTWNELQVQDNNNFAGAPGEFGFWDTTTTVPNLLDSQGVATTLSITATSNPGSTGAFGILDGSSNLGAVATDAVDLMRDYLIGFNGPQTVQLSGFTAGTLVDLYLYGAGDGENRDTLFSVTDINGLHTGTTTGTVTSDTNNPVAHTLTLGGDYVVLSGLVADGSGNITISYQSGGGSNEAPFNGLQAVYAVPEPSAAALLGLAGMALLVRRRI